MNLFNILYMRKTGSFLPGASLAEYLLAGCNGESQKTIDWSPVITVSDALAGPVLDLQTKITAVQSGTGDPTPSNIRPITGWTGANISVNGSTVSVSWQSEAGIVYGGVRNLTQGTLTVTHKFSTINGTDFPWSMAAAGRIFGLADIFEIDNVQYAISNLYIKAPNRSSPTYMSNLNPDYSFCSRTEEGFTKRLYVKDLRFQNDLDGFKEWLDENPLTIVQLLAEPITYTITPTEIALVAGSNTIYSDTGDVKLTYKAGR